VLDLEGVLADEEALERLQLGDQRRVLVLQVGLAQAI
jgi:hypothetical protein